jgi:hypothetical protein
MAADETWHNLATGDIVAARTTIWRSRSRESGSGTSAGQAAGSAEPPTIGLVIVPADIGAAGPRRPVVLTSEGSIGSLAVVLGVSVASDVEIIQGQPASRQDLADGIVDAIASLPVASVDEEGEAVLDVIRQLTGPRPRSADPSRQFSELLQLAGHNVQFSAGPRCALDGNPLPCPFHS